MSDSFSTVWRICGRNILSLFEGENLNSLAEVIYFSRNVELAKVFTYIVKAGYGLGTPVNEKIYLEWVNFYLGGPIPVSPKLITLDLSNTTVADISALARCTLLTYLDLHHTNVEDISALVGCTSLTHLNLYSTNVEDISELVGCTSLTELNLCQTLVVDISVLAKVHTDAPKSWSDTCS